MYFKSINIILIVTEILPNTCSLFISWWNFLLSLAAAELLSVVSISPVDQSSAPGPGQMTQGCEARRCINTGHSPGTAQSLSDTRTVNISSSWTCSVTTNSSIPAMIHWSRQSVLRWRENIIPWSTCIISICWVSSAWHTTTPLLYINMRRHNLSTWASSLAPASVPCLLPCHQQHQMCLQSPHHHHSPLQSSQSNPSQWTPCSTMMAERRSTPWQLRCQNTSATSVARVLPPAPTSPDTSRPTWRWAGRMWRVAIFVTRSMSASQLSTCTCSPTPTVTSATLVVNHSPDPGCYKDTWEVTLERNPMVALTVARSLLTDQTWELTWESTRTLPKQILLWICKPKAFLKPKALFWKYCINQSRWVSYLVLIS